MRTFSQSKSPITHPSSLHLQSLESTKRSYSLSPPHSDIKKTMDFSRLMQLPHEILRLIADKVNDDQLVVIAHDVVPGSSNRYSDQKVVPQYRAFNVPRSDPFDFSMRSCTGDPSLAYIKSEHEFEPLHLALVNKYFYQEAINLPWERSTFFFRRASDMRDIMLFMTAAQRGAIRAIQLERDIGFPLEGWSRWDMVLGKYMIWTHDWFFDQIRRQFTGVQHLIVHLTVSVEDQWPFLEDCEEYFMECRNRFQLILGFRVLPLKSAEVKISWSPSWGGETEAMVQCERYCFLRDECERCCFLRGATGALVRCARYLEKCFLERL